METESVPADAFDSLIDVSTTDAPVTPPVVETPIVPPPSRDDKGRFAAPVVETPAAEAVVEPPVDEKKAKPRHDPEARIDELTRHRREAERRADAAEARLRELEARTTPVAPAKPKAVEDPEPDPANLQTYPEGQYDRKFLKDQARWEARQEIKQAQDKQRAETDFERRYQAFDTRKSGLVAKITDARTADPAFTEKLHPSVLKAVTGSVPASLLDPQEVPTLGNMLVEQLLDSDQPTALLLKLSDPAILQRLATLHPHQAVMELARLEAGLSAAPAAPAVTPKPVASKAKAPIRPLESSPPVADPYELTDDLSVDEHIRRANAAEDRVRRAARR